MPRWVQECYGLMVRIRRALHSRLGVVGLLVHWDLMFRSFPDDEDSKYLPLRLPGDLV